jgi:hypothetical protein
MPRERVRDTAEYQRISALPRRKLSLADAKTFAAQYTKVLRRPKSKAHLLPWQGQALAEIHRVGGGWIALPVGQGKTLISALTPTLFPGRRAALFTTAAIRPQTLADLTKISRDWHLSGETIDVLCYSTLTVESGADLLDRYQPQVLILDEADELANSESAACARIDRYLDEHPDTIVVCLLGTPSRSSIKGYAHLLRWALGEGSPLPLDDGELDVWSSALDDRVRNELMRAHPGVLGHSRGDALAWYSRRLVETPGVLCVDEDSCDAPLHIRQIMAEEDPALDDAFYRLIVIGEGKGLEVALTAYRLEEQYGAGFFTRYAPPGPPLEWRDAHREWGAFCRMIIARSRKTAHPLDTDLQVARRYHAHPTYRAWVAIRDKYTPVMETVWISDSVLRSCEAWLARQTVPSIIWCGSIDFAVALARRTGLEYYGSGGLTVGGSHIIRAPRGRHMIASWNANKKGLNLQDWTTCLIVLPPSSAKWVEQLIGRMHRRNQHNPVTIDVLIGSGLGLDRFERTVEEALFCRDSTTLTQKLLRAQITRAQIKDSANVRWASRKETE